MARYNGHTAWYDAFAAEEPFITLRRYAVELLGAAAGRCLDLGCGTGLTIPLLLEAGWQVVGADVSRDQLAVARERVPAQVEVVSADAHRLPFTAESFDAVVSVLTHTDFDDLGAAFREVHRILRPDGLFVYAGVHPAFGSPAVEPREEAPWLLHRGYREEGWQTVSRHPDRPGIRSRVGINHVTLATLLNAVVGAGLSPELFDEPGTRDPPLFFALRARKT